MSNRSDVGVQDVVQPAVPLSRGFGAPDDVTPALADTARVFGLLSDPGRLRLLMALRAGEASVGELSLRCGLSESGTSHALRLLREHAVVAVRRAGRMAYYRLADQHVADLLEIALAHLRHSRLGPSAPAPAARS